MINHQLFAIRSLKFLAYHVLDYEGGNISVFYSELAREIKYPKPHKGHSFAKNIGKTLEKMGELVNNVPIDTWPPRRPNLQALVVSKENNLPGPGYAKIDSDYKKIDKKNRKEQEAYIKNEHRDIIDFGDSWRIILEANEIE